MNVTEVLHAVEHYVLDNPIEAGLGGALLCWLFLRHVVIGAIKRMSRPDANSWVITSFNHWKGLGFSDRVANSLTSLARRVDDLSDRQASTTDTTVRLNSEIRDLSHGISDLWRKVRSLPWPHQQLPQLPPREKLIQEIVANADVRVLTPGDDGTEYVSIAVRSGVRRLRHEIRALSHFAPGELEREVAATTRMLAERVVSLRVIDGDLPAEYASSATGAGGPIEVENPVEIKPKSVVDLGGQKFVIDSHQPDPEAVQKAWCAWAKSTGGLSR